MDDILLIIIGAAVIIIITGYFKSKSIKENGGKIPNKYADFKGIIKLVEKFEPQIEKKYKDGYTEKSIENQIYKYLKNHYITVTQQHGIADKNARSIDIDVADGIAGIELKIASSVCKTAEFDRLHGQLMAYKKSRYNKSNLALVVCGTDDDRTNSRMQDVEMLCRDTNVTYVYLLIRS